MRWIRGSVKGYKDLAIAYHYIQNDKKLKTLAIFLPGAGYHTTSPLFHFTEEVYLNRGYDVLRVDYRYVDEKYDEFTNEELYRAVKVDTAAVLDKFFSNHLYEEVYIVGKSLGTIAMSVELKKQRFEKAKAIWLTPLINQQDMLEAMIQNPHQAFCFIGNQDRYYSKED
ncbi:alpha/beta fold hydrolase [Planococcus antarcticus]|uniref:alpha/beta hydrolase n=1 Tax=Planococcus antarcticus TaxID=161360 RepID=UPI0009F72621|nr:alpha/beta hydrolase [Planococcus antarcticus]